MGRSWRWLPVFVARAAGCATAPEVGERGGAGGAERPNVVLVLIDDLGFEAIGSYGGAANPTPTVLPPMGSASRTPMPRRCVRLHD